MEFPSIKLNIFKKLEYFLILKELNRQFDGQFEMIKTRDVNDGEFGQFKLDDSNKFVRSVYPTWEVEKKVLFWSYSFHKLLGHEIKDNHFKGMLVSDNEKIYSGGKDAIFQNLEMRNLGEYKEGSRISKGGLAFGELLWYLYEPVKVDESGLFGKIPNLSKLVYRQKRSCHESMSYLDIFKTDYMLNRISFGWLILQSQLISLHLFFDLRCRPF